MPSAGIVEVIKFPVAPPGNTGTGVSGTTGEQDSAAADEEAVLETAVAVEAEKAVSAGDQVVRVSNVALGTTSRPLEAEAARFMVSTAPQFIAELQEALHLLQAGDFSRSDMHLTSAKEQIAIAASVEAVTAEQLIIVMKLIHDYILQIVKYICTVPDSIGRHNQRLLTYSYISNLLIRVRAELSLDEVQCSLVHDLNTTVHAFRMLLFDNVYEINRHPNIKRLRRILAAYSQNTFRGILRRAIELNADRISDSGTEGAEPYLTLTPERAEKLFRILNNILRNAAEHPKPGKRFNKVHFEALNFSLRITDFGTGMSPGAVSDLRKGRRIHDEKPVGDTDSRGIGWLSIGLLADELGLEIYIDSVPDMSTNIEIEYPPGFWDIDPAIFNDFDLEGFQISKAKISPQGKELLAKRTLGLSDNTPATWEDNLLILTPAAGTPNLQQLSETRQRPIYNTRITFTQRTSKAGQMQFVADFGTISP